MLEQQQFEKEAPQYAPIVQNSHSAALALTPHAQALIAGYVAQAEAEQQSAIQQRLEELVAAHLELDAEPEQAARSAIQQIETERLAAEKQRMAAKQQAFVQRKRTRAVKQSARPATLTALKLFGAGSLTIIGTVASVAMLHGRISSFFVAWLFFMYLGLPALLGAAVGARVRHRPAMGTFNAVAMLTLPVSLVATLALRDYWNWQGDLLQMVMIMLLFWMPIGVASAAVTGWGRDTLHRKRRRAQESLAA